MTLPPPQPRDRPIGIAPEHLGSHRRLYDRPAGHALTRRAFRPYLPWDFAPSTDTRHRRRVAVVSTGAAVLYVWQESTALPPAGTTLQGDTDVRRPL
jgi:hypothetical protein